MNIVAIGWAYVVMMMAIAEDTVVAGIMTFVLYGALPVGIILYLGGAGSRRRRRAALAAGTLHAGPTQTTQHADGAHGAQPAAPASAETHIKAGIEIQAGNAAQTTAEKNSG